ncbi:MAG TPA: hypothetical protein VNZ27_03315 [Rhodanobacter sp.]|jgi:hypothetical protein|nr:hypothetical protein [Rhodanobacter sp.]
MNALAVFFFYGDRVVALTDDGYVVGHARGAHGITAKAAISGVSRNIGDQVWISDTGEAIDVCVEDLDYDAHMAERWLRSV